VTGGTGWLGGLAADLAALVLPGGCAGCGAAGTARVCPDCAAGTAALVPAPVRPAPAPPGLPPCAALGGYEGVLRELLLGYKERGRYPLAGPLADLLARVVATAVPATGLPPGVPLLLVPVPDTAAAARSRYGDHMRRLARLAAVRLRVRGWPAAVAAPVRARPRADSAALTAAARLARARSGTPFAVRPGPAARVAAAARAGAAVVLVDDILTTGATLTAVADVLRGAGVPVRLAVVLAATRRRGRVGVPAVGTPDRRRPDG